MRLQLLLSVLAPVISTVCFGAPGVAQDLDATGRVVLEDGRRILFPVTESALPVASEASDPRAPLLQPTGGSASSTFDIETSWSWGPLGGGIGAAGLFVVDIDGLGVEEIVLGGSSAGFGLNRQWHILRWDGESYRQVFSSGPIDGALALSVAQVDDDPQLEILVGKEFVVEVFDGLTRQMQTSLTVHTVTTNVEAADIDGDGVVEVIVCDGNDLHTYSLATGLREIPRYGYGCKDLLLAQMDDDPALEIAITNGTQPAYVLDGLNGAVQWGLLTGLGDRIAAGDLNQDGKADLAGGLAWESVVAYDVFNDMLLWEFEVREMRAITIADIEGDSTPEILWGEGQWGDIHIVGSDGIELWAGDNPDHGVTRIAVGDGDGDTVKEIYWGANHTSSGPDHMYSIDSADHSQDWASQYSAGPHRGIEIGDVDGDGSDEIVVLLNTIERNRAGGFVVFDRETRTLEYESGGLGSGFIGAWGLALIQADADKQLEICVSSSLSSYDGSILCVDGVSHSEEWTFPLPSSTAAASLVAADLGPLGFKLLVGTRRTTSGGVGPFLYALDPATGLLFWRSPLLSVNGDVTMVEVLPDTGQVVVGAHDRWLAILDGGNGLIDVPAISLPVTSLTLSEGGNWLPPILAGTSDGDLVEVDPNTGEATVRHSFTGEDILALEPMRLPAGETILTVSTGTDLALLDRLGGSAVGNLGGFSLLGVFDRMRSADSPDGPTLFVTTLSGVAELRVTVQFLLFADGFESGDTSLWQ